MPRPLLSLFKFKRTVHRKENLLSSKLIRKKGETERKNSNTKECNTVKQISFQNSEKSERIDVQ
jgi:hypothetical protein